MDTCWGDTCHWIVIACERVHGVLHAACGIDIPLCASPPPCMFLCMCKAFPVKPWTSMISSSTKLTTLGENERSSYCSNIHLNTGKKLATKINLSKKHLVEMSWINVLNMKRSFSWCHYVANVHTAIPPSSPSFWSNYRCNYFWDRSKTLDMQDILAPKLNAFQHERNNTYEKE